MPEIAFTLTAENVTRVVDAFCSTHDYDRNKQPDEARPEFARRMIREWMVAQVRSYEAMQVTTNVEIT